MKFGRSIRYSGLLGLSVLILSSPFYPLTTRALLHTGFPLSRYEPVVGSEGMVVSDDPLASKWGAEILRQGGNAVDAAVATAFVLSVTRPHFAALGGGGFLMYCPRPTPQGPSPCFTIDYRETAPQKATKGMYLKDGKPMEGLSHSGPLASAVPGTPAGLLFSLERFGTFPRAKLLSRAIEFAKKGYVFTPYSERVAYERWEAMNPSAQRIFGCQDPKTRGLKPCPAGSLIRQPDLARVLEQIARKGTAGFYKGSVAKKISDGIRKAGGIISEEDLSSYQPQLRTPLADQLGTYQIITLPPPSSAGILILQMLKFAKFADQQGAFKKGFSAADSIHALAHAMGLGFSDRAKYLGDPDYIKVPVQDLLSFNYLNNRWKTFQITKANVPKTAGKLNLSDTHHNTTHFSVLDRQGNAVAVTTTVNNDFGSGFVPPGTGVVMNDEMDDFSIQTGVPNIFGLVGQDANSIEGGKRPVSSMAPTVVRDSKGNNRIIIGAAGGPKIPTSVFTSIWNRVHFEMPLMDAVVAPRFHHQWEPGTLFIERFGFPWEIRSNLEQRGYTFTEVPYLARVYALEHLSNGRILGIADPRGEGCAVAE